MAKERVAPRHEYGKTAVEGCTQSSAETSRRRQAARRLRFARALREAPERAPLAGPLLGNGAGRSVVVRVSTVGHVEKQLRRRATVAVQLLLSERRRGIVRADVRRRARMR